MDEREGKGKGSRMNRRGRERKGKEGKGREGGKEGRGG